MFETFVRFNYTYDPAAVKPFVASCYTDRAGETVRPALHSAPLAGPCGFRSDEHLPFPNHCGPRGSTAHRTDDPSRSAGAMLHRGSLRRRVCPVSDAAGFTLRLVPGYNPAGRLSEEPGRSAQRSRHCDEA